MRVGPWAACLPPSPLIWRALFVTITVPIPPMKPTLIKISISQDGLLPQQSIEMGEVLLQNLPRKLMTALDFEKVEDERKRTTFIGILPVFVVLEEKTQEIEMELTVAHPELRDKVVDIFTPKPPDNLGPAAAKPKPSVNKTVTKSPKSSPAKTPAGRKPKPASSAVKKSAGKPIAKERKRSSATERKKTEPKPVSPARKKGAKKAVKKQAKPLSNKRPSAAGKSAPKGKGGK